MKKVMLFLIFVLFSGCAENDKQNIDTQLKTANKKSNQEKIKSNDIDVNQRNDLMHLLQLNYSFSSNYNEALKTGMFKYEIYNMSSLFKFEDIDLELILFSQSGNVLHQEVYTILDDIFNKYYLNELEMYEYRHNGDSTGFFKENSRGLRTKKISPFDKYSGVLSISKMPDQDVSGFEMRIVDCNYYEPIDIPFGHGHISPIIEDDSLK